MTHPTTEPEIDRPPVNQDLEPRTHVAGLNLSTSQLRAYTMLFALVVIWGYFHFSTNGIFLEARNFSNLMRQTSVTGVLAVGMLMVIVAGQIDLSVGSVVGLTGGISAIMLTWLGWGVGFTLLAAVMLGLIIGAVHGA